jgi:Mpv17 / PMP22 family
MTLDHQETQQGRTSLQRQVTLKHASVSPQDELVSYVVSNLQDCNDHVQETLDMIRHRLQSLDTSRTASMMLYSTALYTPTYYHLFRWYDRVFSATPAGISARVFCTFLSSIPNNTLFFTYGAYWHAMTEWWVQVREDMQNKESDSLLSNLMCINTVLQAHPFDWQGASMAAQDKVSRELVSTTYTSALVWIPVNTLNFCLVPPHVRPLMLAVAAGFWNCYMSLVAHKDNK